MFSLFPADWQAPRPKHLFGSKKPIPSLPIPAIPSKPALPAPAPRPVKIQIPACEMCIGEQLDEKAMAELDKQLNEIWNPTAESQKRQIFRTIDTISEAPRGKPRGIFAEFRRSQPAFALASFGEVRPAIHPRGKPRGILAKANKRYSNNRTTVILDHRSLNA